MMPDSACAPYAQVIVDVVTGALDRPLDYSIPESLRGRILVGSHVLVPLGTRRVSGYVIGLSDRAEVPRTRDIISVVGDSPPLDESMIRLAHWIRERYACRTCDVIRSMLPAAVRNLKVGLRSKRPRHPANTPDGVVPASAAMDGGPAGFRLTPAQANAVAAITRAMVQGPSKPILLHGVTASGKTEVYLRAIDACIGLGKSAIVLVPEISLTPQIVARFKARFGERVAVLHSRLSDGERANDWDRLARRSAQVAIGARSCVFAPCRDLGLIVLDEEHEAAYKQEEAPRYHARDVAIKRGAIEGAAVVLASATPSIESFYKATCGEYDYVELPERIDARPMPRVEVVDMRQEHAAGNKGVFSRRLKDAIAARLDSGECVMLFLNRRGYSTFVLCRECGHALRCPDCDVSLTLHSADGVMRCHWCGHEEPVPLVCPNCKGHRIGQFGVGTERVEAEVRRIFPGARVARMDFDTTRRKGSHESILSAFARGEYDILVGTQMIAKGLDFPDVTLVGVVSADVSLHLPDFRSGERTFQVLVQVAGRCGRGEVPGEVIIQTFSPSHYSIVHALNHDYRGFYESEIPSRQELGYPPFSHIISVVATSRDEALAVKALGGISSRISPAKVLGPSPLAMRRAKGEYRWHILIKAQDIMSAANLVRGAALDVSKEAARAGVKVTVDVDPQDMI